MNANDSAFPVPHAIDGNWQQAPVPEFRGISARTYIATAALQGLLASELNSVEPPDVAAGAVKYADALLAELAKKDA